ncbi:MAG: LytR C-terminal domain-containing protein [Fibrobacter sp.]|nr:LytR C-terminal domain-containing protein [Fibrobacter sp.]
MRLLICLIFCLVFLGCEEEKVQPKVQEIKRTYKGDVELLNSCGMDGAASKMKVYLRENGFDVVSTKNDIVQNYEQTILVLRNPEWEGAQALAKALKTKNVITVMSKRALVDASVYIGKDLKQIVEPEQGE